LQAQPASIYSTEAVAYVTSGMRTTSITKTVEPITLKVFGNCSTGA